ncbi:E3 ubiquitin-protein ligase RING1-like [Senna tora]|uniref:RING-type E3 ubiquitin transferase n=1 Tax=Senna tora TaxID=362788 RepID=A0A835CJM8_9FABA|nr:E3 ubiquitin-protein ligase RING1-like [Senna tora]
MIPASQEAIESLNTAMVKGDVNDVAIIDGDYCCICFEEYHDEEVEISIMPCHHVYHNNCIVEWLKISHLCPLCRFEMPMNYFDVVMYIQT